MRGDQLIATQLQMAQAANTLAEHLLASTGMQLTPVTFSALPVLTAPKGAMAAITDSTVNTWGAVIAGGGAFTVLAWHNGTNWTVVGA